MVQAEDVASFVDHDGEEIVIAAAPADIEEGLIIEQDVAYPGIRDERIVRIGKGQVVGGERDRGDSDVAEPRIALLQAERPKRGGSLSGTTAMFMFVSTAQVWKARTIAVCQTSRHAGVERLKERAALPTGDGPIGHEAQGEFRGLGPRVPEERGGEPRFQGFKAQPSRSHGSLRALGVRITETASSSGAVACARSQQMTERGIVPEWIEVGIDGNHIVSVSPSECGGKQLQGLRGVGRLLPRVWA